MNLAVAELGLDHLDVVHRTFVLLAGTQMLQVLEIPNVYGTLLSSRNNVPIAVADVDVHDDVGVGMQHPLQAAVAGQPYLNQPIFERELESILTLFKLPVVGASNNVFIRKIEFDARNGHWLLANVGMPVYGLHP